jgi:hypothetical protein
MQTAPSRPVQIQDNPCRSLGKRLYTAIHKHHCPLDTGVSLVLEGVAAEQLNEEIVDGRDFDER